MPTGGICAGASPDPRGHMASVTHNIITRVWGQSSPAGTRVRGSGEQALWSWKSFNHCVPSESRKLHHYLYFANSQTPRYLWYISKTRRYRPQRWTALCVSRISIWSCTACGVQSKLAQNITNILAQTVMKETQNHNSIILVQGRPSPKANEEKVVCITKIRFEYCPLWICHWQ